jgi:hypothetical protein
VTVGLNHRDGGAISPCKWGSRGEIYNFAERAKVYAAKDRLENVQHELGIHEQRYQQLTKMRQALNKELPLDEIMDSIESITINEGRRIEVKWREIC